MTIAPLGGKNVAAEILGLLQDNYCDRDDLRRWLATTAATELARATAPSPQGNDTIAEGLAQLRLSHTRRFTPDEIEYYHLLDAYASAGLSRRVRQIFPGGIRYDGIALLAERRAGRFYAAAVVPQGPAELAGIVRGDELLAVDDVPFSPVAAFKGRAGRSVTLQVRRSAEGPIQRILLTPRPLRPRVMFKRATRFGTRVIHLGGHAMVGYAKPWSLAGDDHWQALVSAIKTRLQDCVALVLDLRQGIGGASPEHAEFFVGRAPELKLSTPDFEPMLINPRWHGRLIVLADESTRSGNEVLVFALQRAGVPVVGGRTAGAVTMATPFILADGSLLLVATHFVEVDGQTLEGRGVVPDLVVDAPLAYAAGSDPALESALRLAGT
jgi:carboxyl-terminal processing protease